MKARITGWSDQEKRKVTSMTRFKGSCVFLLAAVLSCSLSACGSAETNETSETTAGEDWRVSGVVVDSGTITHTYEGSVDVLVTVSHESAAFYRDMKEQVLFDSVLFPMDIPDAEEAFNYISFEDIDGDEESDVLVSFVHENGDITELIWIWDPEERYIYREDLSFFSTEEEDSDEYMTENTEEVQTSIPCFSRNGLEINAAMDMGTFLLENGVCNYSGLGDGYRTDDCYWELIKRADYTHDGIREIEFDAVCYIPESSIPYFDQQYFTITSSELYDYNTGMWLTAASSNGNSSRGENYYLHNVSWNGSDDLIEFAYSTDWQYNVSDWAMVFTKSYIVYLPEGYDSLIFAAEAQPDNYKDCAKRMLLDSISPDASIMNLDTVDPYSALYFSVCY